MNKLEQVARQALEALEWYVEEDDVMEAMPGNEPWVEGKRNAEKSITALREALEQEPVQTREQFESWAKAYSTLALAKDSHGYADMTVEMLWHAWQAAKINAPEGASGGESDANALLGLVGHDSNCKHEFSVQPSSGIRLCAHCGLSEVATRKHTAPQPTRQPLSDKQIQDIWCSARIEGNQHGPFWFARAIEKAHWIGGKA